jgi:hypothetical protein
VRQVEHVSLSAVLRMPCVTSHASIECKSQDSVGGIGIILRVVPCWKPVFSGRLPPQIAVPIHPQNPGIYTCSSLCDASRSRWKSHQGVGEGVVLRHG